MKTKPWVGLTVNTGLDAEEWFGELECTLEQFFAKPQDAFVRLDHVVWLESSGEYEEPRIVRNDSSDLPFEHYLYIRKGDVVMVRPMRFAINAADVED